MKITLPIQLVIERREFSFQFGRFQMLWQLDPSSPKAEFLAMGRKEFYRKPLETGFHFFGTHLMMDLHATPADIH